MSLPTLRIGTRSSALALWQANFVADQLNQLGAAIELVPISTTGDRATGTIADSGEVGVFTKELQAALIEERIDIAVHSLKDLPTLVHPRLVLAAVPARGSIHDALITRMAPSLDALPAGSRVGTGSPRRQAQLLRFCPDLNVVGIRGNVDTRLKKLDSGEFDALVLAAAGLERLGLAERITERLAPSVMMPAPAQGALGIETRRDDVTTAETLRPLNHLPTFREVSAEREFMRVIEAGCHSAAAAWCRQIDHDRWQLDAAVLSLDGATRIDASAHGTLDGAVELGRQAADELLQQGAQRLCREV